MRRFVAATSVLGATALVPSVVAAQVAVAKWSISIEQRYGDQPGTELANPQTIGIDGSGRLYVADSRPAAVKVFNVNGTLLRTIGREGSGPGEYRNPWIAVRGSLVVVHDPAQSRTSSFDTSGKYLRSWTTFCCHQNEIAIDRSARIVIPAVLSVPSTDPRPIHRSPYVRFTAEGRVVDTLSIPSGGEERLWSVPRRGTDGKPGNGSTSIVIPFTPHQYFAWDPAGGYVAGWSGNFQLFRSSGRDSVRLVSVTSRPATIPDAMRRARVDTATAQLGGIADPATARIAVRLSDVPTNAPAFTRLLIDEEGNLWARQLLGASRGTTMFRVFDSRGADLGEAVVPVVVPDWGGVAFGQGTMFVRSEDGSGQPIVVRLRVRRN